MPEAEDNKKGFFETTPQFAWDMFKAGAKDWYAGGVGRMMDPESKPVDPIAYRKQVLAGWQPTPVSFGQSQADKKNINMAEAQSVSDAVPRTASGQTIDFPDAPGLTPQEKNLLDYHRSNLRNGSFIEKNGVYTTQALIGVRGPDGRVYNIPSFWGGAVRSPEMSAMMASRVGWDKFPSYRSGDEADRAARALHPIVADDSKRYDSWKSAQPMNQAAEQNAKNMEMMAKAGGAPVGSAVGRLMQWMKNDSDQLPKGARPMEGESPFATFRQRWPQEIWPSNTQNKEGVPMSPRIERPEYALPNQYPPMNDPIRRAHEELNEAMSQKVNRVKDKKERYIGADTEESVPVPKTDPLMNIDRYKGQMDDQPTFGQYARDRMNKEKPDRYKIQDSLRDGGGAVDRLMQWMRSDGSDIPGRRSDVDPKIKMAGDVLPIGISPSDNSGPSPRASEYMLGRRSEPNVVSISPHPQEQWRAWVDRIRAWPIGQGTK